MILCGIEDSAQLCVHDVWGSTGTHLRTTQKASSLPASSSETQLTCWWMHPNILKQMYPWTKLFPYTFACRKFCMHIHKHLHVDKLFTFTYMHVHTHIHTYKYIPTHICNNILFYMCKHIYIFMFFYRSMFIYIYLFMYFFIFIYIAYACMHTYIHTYHRWGNQCIFSPYP